MKITAGKQKRRTLTTEVSYNGIIGTQERVLVRQGKQPSGFEPFKFYCIKAVLLYTLIIRNSSRYVKEKEKRNR